MKLLPNINSLKEIDTLENLGVTIEFDPQNEDMRPDLINDEEEERVIDDYNNGNMAAWFCAKVSVSYKELSADDYLGGCSYKSFKEFTTEENGYYQDMINVCINEINRQVESINYSVQRRWNIRKAKNLLAPYGMHIVSSKVLGTV